MALYYSGPICLLLFLLPYSHGYDVYWNVPSFKCKRFGVHLNLTKYNIKQNEEDNWRGSVMNILYHPGEFPYITKKGEWKYGGLPQSGNLTRHLEVLASDVEKTIPKNYTGLAVLDQERWRPIYNQNWRPLQRYKLESDKLVQQKHPDWKRNQVKAEAARQFEDDARNYMEKSLKLCKSLRPKGKWGYYHFPYCFNSKFPSKPCRMKTQEENNKLDWMYRLSDALYPSIYLNKPMTEEQRRLHAFGRITEAMRMSARIGHHPPVFPYVRITFARYGGHVSRTDLKNTIGLSKKMGAAGAVIWESSYNTNTKEKCQELKNFIAKDLGPLVRDLTKD